MKTADGPRRAVRRGAETEGMAVGITAGQRVFVGPLSHEGKAGLTEHQDLVMELDDNHLIPVTRERIHPWHECLPAVAAWMAETPNALEDLRTLRWALDQLGHIDEEQAVPTLDALVAALSTDGGA